MLETRARRAIASRFGPNTIVDLLTMYSDVPGRIHAKAHLRTVDSSTVTVTFEPTSVSAHVELELTFIEVRAKAGMTLRPEQRESGGHIPLSDGWKRASAEWT